MVINDFQLSEGFKNGFKIRTAGQPVEGPFDVGRRQWISGMGSGANLLYCMDINAKFDFIDQQANNNIVHLF